MVMGFDSFVRKFRGFEEKAGSLFQGRRAG